jgi:hypothetical protein
VYVASCVAVVVPGVNTKFKLEVLKLAAHDDAKVPVKVNGVDVVAALATEHTPKATKANNIFFMIFSLLKLKTKPKIS